MMVYQVEVGLARLLFSPLGGNGHDLSLAGKSRPASPLADHCYSLQTAPSELGHCIQHRLFEIG